MRLLIRAEGRPAPEGSHDTDGAGNVRHASVYLPAWRREVALATARAMRASGLTGIGWVWPRPTPIYVHEVTHLVMDVQCRAEGTAAPTGAPDVDKLLRATIDGIGDVRLFEDDSQIVKIHEIGKRRTLPGEAPGAIIIISDEPPGAAVEQGEQEVNEFRIVLERVTGRDGEGFRNYETVMELHGAPEVIAQTGVTTLGALLGLEGVSIMLPAEAAVTTERAAPAAAPAKRGPGRPRKTTAAAAETPAAAPEAPAEPAAPAEPVSEPQAPAEPAEAPRRVNPFAQ